MGDGSSLRISQGPIFRLYLRIMTMTFEDLESWQKARQIVRKIYKLTRADQLCRDFGICGQVQRAGVSIMSNVGSAP